MIFIVNTILNFTITFGHSDTPKMSNKHFSSSLANLQRRTCYFT